MEGSKGEIAKQLTVLILANLCLSTYDVYTDVTLILTLLANGSLKLGLTLMIPLLLNIAATTFQWWRYDSPKEKRWTWILVVLLLWPQYKAVRVIILLFKDYEKSQEKTIQLERDIDGVESFVEAAPTVIILTTYVFFILDMIVIRNL